MNRKIYLDLDGVMADFDTMFPNTFGLDHKQMGDDEMWNMINSHSSYFRDMPIFDGAKEFWENLMSLEIPVSILTACPKSNYQNAAKQKRQWVYDNICPNVTVLPVMGGINKPLFMHSPKDILIDDWHKNCTAWDAAGGVSIIHKNYYDTWNSLRNEVRWDN